MSYSDRRTLSEQIATLHTFVIGPRREKICLRGFANRLDRIIEFACGMFSYYSFLESTNNKGGGQTAPLTHPSNSEHVAARMRLILSEFVACFISPP